MPKGSKALQHCQIVFAGVNRDEKAQATKWLTGLSGRVSTSITNGTTHVVCTKPAFKGGHKLVEAAYQENGSRSENKQIKFVSMAWVDDCSTQRTKKGEGPYLCEKYWKDPGSTANSMAGAPTKAPRTHAGLLKETVLESTNQHVDERTRQDIDKEISALEKRKRAEQKAIEEEEKEERMKEAQMFQKEAKKARNEIFTENHHIYTDSTGFKYDVIITKVDTRNNRNERIALTIYESNAEPYTYATNIQFAGTHQRASNNLLAAIGTPFPTAFHVFKSYFKERAGVDWDDRIIYAIERVKRDRRDRGQGTGSDAGSRKGVPVASEFLRAEKEKEWKDRKFEYHPPRFGPRGSMSKEKIAEIERLVGAKGGGRDDGKVMREKVDAWMSGGNGDAVANAPSQNKSPAVVDGYIDLSSGEIDLTAAEGIGMDGEAANDDPGHGTVGSEQLEEIVDKTYPFDADMDLEAPPDPNFNFDEFFGGPVVSNEDQPTNPTTAEDFEHDSYPAEPADVQEEAPELSFAQDAAEEYPESCPVQGAVEKDPATSHNATQTTSFDVPPSTVLESFQPGTQEVGETQRAERARNEFEEAMENDQYAGLPDEELAADTHGAIDAEAEAGQEDEDTGQTHDATEVDAEVEVGHNGADDDEAAAAALAPKALNLGSSILGKGLNFGKSMLGKRKEQDTGMQQEEVKKARLEEVESEAKEGDGEETHLLDSQLNGDEVEGAYEDA
ncbi:uncharacterized protein LTR77_005020 [Saxophila tyrrhenica]|uniref:BRCT domain-containing protein n=1 Tax=Saxophila tyrrhenica TaxID=1690608 RepID=A0AAV9PDX1_9PEZI|nr:hypothetical protein LTR77_005020 [Saxophila tyrrhenica]